MATKLLGHKYLRSCWTWIFPLTKEHDKKNWDTKGTLNEEHLGNLDLTHSSYSDFTTCANSIHYSYVLLSPRLESHPASVNCDISLVFYLVWFLSFSLSSKTSVIFRISLFLSDILIIRFNNVWLKYHRKDIVSF